MNDKDILVKINEAFTCVLGHNNFNLNENTSAKDVDGWESITHMMIIEEIEIIFNIKFSLMDLMNMNSVGDLIKSIESSLKNN